LKVGEVLERKYETKPRPEDAFDSILGIVAFSIVLVALMATIGLIIFL